MLGIRPKILFLEKSTLNLLVNVMSCFLWEHKSPPTTCTCSPPCAPAHTLTSTPPPHMLTSMHNCTHAHFHTPLHTRSPPHTPAHMLISMHLSTTLISMHTCTHAHLHAHMHKRSPPHLPTHTLTSMHICTHAHLHTPLPTPTPTSTRMHVRAHTRVQSKTLPNMGYAISCVFSISSAQ